MLNIYGSGRLATNPEMRSITSNRTGEVTSFCTVRLASHNDYPSEKTSFVRINAWGAKATYLFKAGTKGSYLEFDGELTIPEYDKEKERQYEPEIQIGGKGHLRVLVLQKKPEKPSDEGVWIDGLEEDDIPYYGKGVE